MTFLTPTPFRLMSGTWSRGGVLGTRCRPWQPWCGTRLRDRPQEITGCSTVITSRLLHCKEYIWRAVVRRGVTWKWAGEFLVHYSFIKLVWILSEIVSKVLQCNLKSDDIVGEKNQRALFPCFSMFSHVLSYLLTLRIQLHVHAWYKSVAFKWKYTTKKGKMI